MKDDGTGELVNYKSDDLPTYASGGATFDLDGRYRYLLSRVIEKPDEQRHVLFVMLNPSTADWQLDDPTIRKCRGFTLQLGYARFNVVNLFGLRATDPQNLWWDSKDKEDRKRRPMNVKVGAANDKLVGLALQRCKAYDGLAIAAWGRLQNVDQQVRIHELLELARAEGVPLHTLALTDQGHPRHPLMLGYMERDLQPFRGF